MHAAILCLRSRSSAETALEAVWVVRQTQLKHVFDRKQFSEITIVREHKHVSVFWPSEITPLVINTNQCRWRFSAVLPLLSGFYNGWEQERRSMKQVCWPNCRVSPNFYLQNQLQSTVRDVSVSPLPSVQSDSICDRHTTCGKS